MLVIFPAGGATCRGVNLATEFRPLEDLYDGIW